ncbi:MAG: hypothetical protein ACFCUE_15520 [Candidatus Bathyarchaeia archaeon]|jgi:hypothetical protein
MGKRLTWFALMILVLTNFTIIGNAAPDSTEPSSTPSENLSIGQIVGLTISVLVAIVGLWLYFREPKSKKKKVFNTHSIEQSNICLFKQILCS